MAVIRGPYISALQPDTMAQLAVEVDAKEKKGQCQRMLWDDTKDNPSPEMKVSPLAMIPYKPCLFRAILDLPFAIRLSSGKNIQSVNETTEKTAPESNQPARQFPDKNYTCIC